MLKKSKHHMSLQERFEQGFVRGPEDRCWLWRGNLDKKGYGGFRIGNYNTRAHRVSHMIYKGPIPDGMETLHSCDNAACVNPNHLSFGTPMQNQDEAWRRSRRLGTHKLSRDDVLAIKSSLGTHSDIAARYGIGQSHVSRLKSGLRGVGILKEGILRCQ